jgi:hypothetical protein
VREDALCCCSLLAARTKGELTQISQIIRLAVFAFGPVRISQISFLDFVFAPVSFFVYFFVVSGVRSA